MKSLSRYLGLLLGAALLAHAATAGAWINDASITSWTNVQSSTFWNRATMWIPEANMYFSTRDTLFFTNSGYMSSVLGWELDYNKTMAARVENQSGASIASSQYSVFMLTNTPGLDALAADRILLQATNIVNNGSLQVSANGWLRLAGSNVDLTKGTLQAAPIVGGGHPFIEGVENQWTNVTLDAGLSDFYWMFNTNMTSYGNEFWDGFTADAEDVQLRCPLSPLTYETTSLGFTPTVKSACISSNAVLLWLTNSALQPYAITVSSNIVRQLVLVRTTHGLSGDVHWCASSQATNLFKTVAVQLRAPFTNQVDGTVSDNQVFLYDWMMSETNQPLLTNAITATTVRPGNYMVARSDGLEGYYEAGVEDASEIYYAAAQTYWTDAPGGDFVWFSALTNVAPKAIYTAWVGAVNNLPYVPPAAHFSSSNMPGKVQIYADQLNLNRCKIGAEGEIRLQANNLVGSNAMVLDCENLSFDLNSASDTVRFKNLVTKDSVTRLRGTVTMFSAAWTNAYSDSFQNYSTNSDGTLTNSFVTNNTTVTFQVTLVDASGMSNQVPVNVYDLVTHSTNTVIDDNMRVVHQVLINGVGLAINGDLSLSAAASLTADYQVAAYSSLSDWNGATAPNLLNFTNTGELLVPGNFDAGADRVLPYAVFKNSGTVLASGISVNSAYVENGPLAELGSYASAILAGDTAVLGGYVEAGYAVGLNFNNLMLTNSLISTGTRMDLTVSNIVCDQGTNIVSITSALDAAVKPRVGDLKNTIIQDYAADGVEVPLTWPGWDIGAVQAGFTNNLALGRLVLLPGGSDASFSFMGIGNTNALYVNSLVLTNLGHDSAGLSNYLVFAQGMRVYFKNAVVANGFVVPSGYSSVNQYLNGMFGGQLRFVDFSSTTNIGTAISTNIVDSGSNTNTDKGDGSGGSDGGSTNNPTTGLSGAPVLSGPEADSASATNAFAQSKGTYVGLFSSTNGVVCNQAGYVSATVSTKGTNGTYSAKLFFNGSSYTFSGTFGSSGVAVKTNKLSGTNFIVLQLQLASTNQLTGTFGDLAGSWSASLLADKVVFSSKNPTPDAAAYTMLIPPSTNGPAGFSYGTVTISKTGSLKWSGVLADGTVVSQGTYISRDSYWPLFASLYKGKGSVLSWISFDKTQTNSDFSGALVWTKLRGASLSSYLSGFTNYVMALGSVYQAPTNSTKLLGVNSGVLTLSEGGISRASTNPFSLDNKTKVTVLGGDSLKLTIKPASGLFSGTVKTAAEGKLSFRGVLFEKGTNGAGFFLNGSQSGRVEVQP